MKAVTFIVARPLEERDYIRFGMRELVSHGVEINVIQISALVFSFVQPYKNENSDYSFPIHTVSTLNELRRLLNKINTKRIITIGILPEKVTRVLKYSNDVELGMQMLGSSPSVSTHHPLLVRLKRLTLKSIYNKSCTYINKEEHYSVIFYAGKAMLDHANKKKPQAKKIPCHSYDYYLSQMISNKTTGNEEPIVFIDQMLPFHSDFKLLFGQKNVEYHKYYEKLNILLNKAAVLFNRNVIICAHPRVNELEFDYSEFFPGFLVEGGNTSQLIKQSFLCVTHYSTSIGMAVMHNKPVLLLNANLLRERNVEVNLLKFSNEINCSIIDIDTKYKLCNSILNIDKGAYQEYSIKYISDLNNKLVTNGQIMMKEFCS